MPRLRKSLFLGISSLLIVSVPPVIAQETARKTVEGLSTVEFILEKTKPLFEYRDANLNGGATEEQTRKAADSFDAIGSKAAATVAVASGGSLMGATSGMAAGPLMNIAKWERESIAKLSPVEEMMRATETGHIDSAAISRLDQQMDQARAEAGRSAPQYGSTWDNLTRIIDSSGLSSKLESSADVGMLFLKNSVERMQNYLKDDQGKPPVPQPAPAVQAQVKPPQPATLPTCGSMDYFQTPGDGGCKPKVEPEQAPTADVISGMTWKMVSQKVSYSNPQPLTSECFPAPADFVGFANSEAADFIESVNGVGGMACKAEKLQFSGSTAKFLYNCRVAGQLIVGAYVFQQKGENITSYRQEQDGSGSDMTEQFEYAKCVPDAIDCSPAGQAKYKAEHRDASGHTPAMYMCENPL